MEIGFAPIREPISSPNWARWFNSITIKLQAISSQSDELKTKVVSSEDEPAISQTGALTIWNDTVNNKTYLVYKKTDAVQLKVELI